MGRAMQFITKSGKAIQFSFQGLSVAMVSSGPNWPVAYAHRTWVNGECFQGPARFGTRSEATKAALASDHLFRTSDTFFGMTWDRVPEEDDRTVMVRAFKAYRQMGIKPAAAIDYARNQVAFSHDGW